MERDCRYIVGKSSTRISFLSGKEIQAKLRPAARFVTECETGIFVSGHVTIG